VQGQSVGWVRLRLGPEGEMLIVISFRDGTASRQLLSPSCKHDVTSCLQNPCSTGNAPTVPESLFNRLATR
jgi:hypothetical protein